MTQDQEHLRILSIFYYVFGALGCVCSCIPIIHVGMGVALMAGGVPTRPGEPPVPQFVGIVFVVVAGCFILFGWTLAICTILTGKFLAEQRYYIFCMVMAGIACSSVPLGTILGVCTFIVLARPSVRELFVRNQSGGAVAVTTSPV